MKTPEQLAAEILPCRCDLGSDRGPDHHGGACPAAYRVRVAAEIAREREETARVQFKRETEQDNRERAITDQMSLIAELRKQRDELAALLGWAKIYVLEADTTKATDSLLSKIDFAFSKVTT